MPVHNTSFKGCPAITLSYAGAESTVLLHGAQVMSWVPAGCGEQLYFSDKADYSPGSAIRGGIPVCFPQFGLMGDLPMHGFVRNMDWEFKGFSSHAEKETVSLKLASSNTTRSQWNHDFTAILHLSLGAASMSVELEIGNTGTRSFSFRCAFHTYFRVSDIHAVRIEGLSGMPVHDKVAGTHSVASADIMKFEGFTERIYATGGRSLVLRSPASAVRIASEHMPDAVVWNPWDERACQIPDFPDDDYVHMLCLESAAIDEPVGLEPGTSWKGSHILTMI